MLTEREIASFVEDGFVAVRGAFPRDLAERGRAELWADLGCDPDDPATWTRPVVRLGGYHSAPFVAAANTPALHAAYDRLAGAGRWRAPLGLGTFPVRFPSEEPPGDDGWHLDASFSGAQGEYRVNLRSRGRALLMLFLFSDTGPDDAPTRIRVGSHRDVPPLLADAGEEGREWFELCGEAAAAGEGRPEALATGEAGDVFLCHPFLVHAAQPHRGSAPRFLAQPPLLPVGELDLDAAEPTPVERAVVQALAGR
ncbi:phytanoyl-CoA dioxygenase family protein [Streptomonospora sp. S1-112]|uniref:Phytanoyl-CoA dioxygenase family protein n=1 Tax=Streptomonospora mangrovi TaxID=2883123 RepID=A0A9X3NHX2_9ACTN|nr:phytanoyl-CoA dioxygenase family protein [Streptomonospora mangrovi]MDA0564109.1 phytanoyl-CoA dioxygenase family protein [Streptomonospora mangrovi]